jgi:hypothetical protein
MGHSGTEEWRVAIRGNYLVDAKTGKPIRFAKSSDHRTVELASRLPEYRRLYAYDGVSWTEDVPTATLVKAGLLAPKKSKKPSTFDGFDDV